MNILNTLQKAITFDTFTSNDSVKVLIEVPNRRTLPGYIPVQGILLNDLSFSTEAKWGDAVSGFLGSLNAGIESVDKFMQASAGASIKQPWFSRQTYQGTAPLEFSLDFRFVADRDQDLEVMTQVNRLLGLCYPRKTGIVSQLSTALGNIVDFYAIPGPNPFFPVVLSGDYLNISIGSFFYWEACYIRTISGTLSSSLGANGLPNYADVKITFRTMDAQFVNDDGTFNVFKTNYKSLIDGPLKVLQTNYQAAQDAIVNSLKATSGGG